MNTAGIAAKTLSLHNGYRAQHGVAPLNWCGKLETEATEYARSLAARNLPVVPKSGAPYGQNVFEYKSSVPVDDLTAIIERGITAWYKGVEDYNFVKGSSHGGQRGQLFSQIVWKSTERIGLGVATSPDKTRVVVIAFYDPRGNVSGDFHFNVFTVQKHRVDNSTTQQQQSNVCNTANNLSNLNIRDGSTVRRDKHETESSNVNQNEITHTINVSSTSSTSSTRSTAQNVETSQTYESDRTVQSGQNISRTDTNDHQYVQETQNGSAPQSARSPCNVAGPPQDLSPAEAKALELHNQLRQKHQVGSMVIDKKLTEAAAIHAKSLLSGNKAQGHLGLVDVGKNVYQIGSATDAPQVAVVKAIESWYSHVKDYNWTARTNSGKFAGLFSQLVWKDSVRLGVGVATRGDLTIVVCLYAEQGNVASEQSHRENVKQAIF